MRFILLILLGYLNLAMCQKNNTGVNNTDLYKGESRIVGGTVAFDKAAPFIVSIRQGRNHFCGGSIISDEWVLTASHCLDGRSPYGINVLAGTNHIIGMGQIIQAAQLIMHGSYNYPTKYAHDIGLIRLQGRFIFNEKVQPIGLQSEELSPGTIVTAYGWGQFGEYQPFPEWLQTITLNVISDNECARFINSHESHICTFTQFGKGTCYGDSGGPLIANGNIVGVVSFGIPCAVGKPDAFGKVSYFRNWIRSITGV